MTRMKGLFKGIKKISQIFVYKEPEMEIGYPTDVKHVTHIGWDNTTSLDSPTWMNEFKTACDFSSKSSSNFVQSKECSWECQDFSQIKTQQHPSGFFTEPQLISEKPKSAKKVKKKKKKKLKDSSPTLFSVFSTIQC